MSKPTKEEYTQYWIYSKGQLIKQGVGAIPAEYKSYPTVETEFKEAEYKSALAKYNLEIKELEKELAKYSLTNPAIVHYAAKILEANTPQKVAILIKEIMSPVSNFETFIKDFNLEDFWK